MEEEVRIAERALRRAVLDADVDALDGLLADEVLYVAPDGSTLDKAADLQAYRSGDLRIHRYDPRGEPSIRRVADEVVLLTTVVDLAAEFRGAAHAGVFRYTRLYVRRAAAWRIAFAQAAALPS